MPSLSNLSPVAVHRIALISLVMTCTLTAATLLVPAPSDTRSLVFHSLFAITTFVAIGYLCASTLFALGLYSFTPELKKTYTVLVTGFALLGVGYLQLPFMPLFHLERSFWFAYGVVGLPFIAGIGCIYAGLRGFAKLFGVRHVLMSAWATMGFVLLGGSLSVLLPHGTPNIPLEDSAIAVSKFAQMTPGLVTVASAVLCFSIRKRAGSARSQHHHG